MAKKPTLLSRKDLMVLFDVSDMTIWRWRQKHGLGELLVDIPGRTTHGRGSVTVFDLDSILEWAKQHEKPVYLTRWRKWRKDLRSAKTD